MVCINVPFVVFITPLLFGCSWGLHCRWFLLLLIVPVLFRLYVVDVFIGFLLVSFWSALVAFRVCFG